MGEMLAIVTFASTGQMISFDCDCIVGTRRFVQGIRLVTLADSANHLLRARRPTSEPYAAASAGAGAVLGRDCQTSPAPATSSTNEQMPTAAHPPSTSAIPPTAPPRPCPRPATAKFSASAVARPAGDSAASRRAVAT